MSLSDFYKILQVHPEAEIDVIEAAYKRLAKKYHPDVAQIDAQLSIKQMQEINEAYAVLRNPETRQTYHKKWHQAFAKVGSDHNPIKDTQFKRPESQAAYRLLYQYFTHIQNKKYLEAYELISQKDKEIMQGTQFIKWQLNVSRIFALQNFEIQVGLSESHDKSPSSILYQRFVVLTVDYNAIMERLEQDVFEKKVCLERGKWKVVLDLKDPTYLIHHYEQLSSLLDSKALLKTYVASISKQDALTGMLNKKGFIDELDREALRFMRYNRRFCVVQIGFITKKPQDKLSTLYIEQVALFMSTLLKNKCRQLDSLGRIDEQVFLILMPETDLRGGLMATQKLKRALSKELQSSSANMARQEVRFPASVDVFSGDIAMLIDRLDYLYELSIKHKLNAIQSIRGAITE